MVLRNHRKSMRMDTFEMVSMLRHNRHLWDAQWLLTSPQIDDQTEILGGSDADPLEQHYENASDEESDVKFQDAEEGESESDEEA